MKSHLEVCCAPELLLGDVVLGGTTAVAGANGGGNCCGVLFPDMTKVAIIMLVEFSSACCYSKFLL